MMGGGWGGLRERGRVELVASGELKTYVEREPNWMNWLDNGCYCSVARTNNIKLVRAPRPAVLVPSFDYRLYRCTYSSSIYIYIYVHVLVLRRLHNGRRALDLGLSYSTLSAVPVRTGFPLSYDLRHASRFFRLVSADERTSARLAFYPSTFPITLWAEKTTPRKLKKSKCSGK